MRKKLLCLLLALLLLCSISVLASAEALAGDVTFTAAGRMEEENFNVDQVFSGLEPGDERSYTVYVHNRHPQTTRWYMSNEVLKSLEESAAAGKILARIRFLALFQHERNRFFRIDNDAFGNGVLNIVMVRDDHFKALRQSIPYFAC